MKKIITLMLVVVMAFGMVGCGKSADDNSSASAGNKYIIATDTTFAPFEFENEEDAAKAMEALNNSEQMGRNIAVKEALPKPDRV